MINAKATELVRIFQELLENKGIKLSEEIYDQMTNYFIKELESFAEEIKTIREINRGTYTISVEKTPSALTLYSVSIIENGSTQIYEDSLEADEVDNIIEEIISLETETQCKLMFGIEHQYVDDNVDNNIHTTIEIADNLEDIMKMSQKLDWIYIFKAYMKNIYQEPEDGAWNYDDHHDTFGHKDILYTSTMQFENLKNHIGTKLHIDKNVFTFDILITENGEFAIWRGEQYNIYATLNHEILTIPIEIVEKSTNDIIAEGEYKGTIRNFDQYRNIVGNIVVDLMQKINSGEQQ